MSASSPSRRAASVTAAELGTVNPTSLFGYDPWAEQEHSPENNYETSGYKFSISSPFNKKASAGSELTSGFTMGGRSVSVSGPAGGGKRAQVDSFHLEPETPLRKIRGHSSAGLGSSGLITPQSASRSFSTSSLPKLNTPTRALYSPLDTPLATPSNQLFGNPFDTFYETKGSNEWPFKVDVHHSGSSLTSLSTSSLVGPSELTRCSSVTSLCSRSEDDYLNTPVGTESSTTSKNTGVNPFYCPPPCLRQKSSAKVGGASCSFGSISELGHVSSEADDAGVSPRDFVGEFERMNNFPEEHEVSGIFGGCLNENDCGHDHHHHHVDGDSDEHSHEHSHEQSSGGYEHLHDLETHEHEHCHSHAMLEGEFFRFPLGAELSSSPSAMLSRSHSAAGHQITMNDISSISERGRSRSSSSVSCASSQDALDKPFRCTVCSKSFRRMEHLRRHQKTHTLERPFVCTVPNCGRRFSRTDNLKAHILTHTKKTGRNIYVEGLAEAQDIKPIKRRKPKKNETEIAV